MITTEIQVRKMQLLGAQSLCSRAEIEQICRSINLARNGASKAVNSTDLKTQFTEMKFRDIIKGQRARRVLIDTMTNGEVCCIKQEQISIHEMKAFLILLLIVDQKNVVDQ
jgi:hypothetical protein